MAAIPSQQFVPGGPVVIDVLADKPSSYMFNILLTHSWVQVPLCITVSSVGMGLLFAASDFQGVDQRFVRKPPLQIQIHLQFGQIHLSSWTNTFWNVYKYIFKFPRSWVADERFVRKPPLQIHFPPLSSLTSQRSQDRRRVKGWGRREARPTHFNIFDFSMHLHAHHIRFQIGMGEGVAV